MPRQVSLSDISVCMSAISCPIYLLQCSQCNSVVFFLWFGHYIHLQLALLWTVNSWSAPGWYPYQVLLVVYFKPLRLFTQTSRKCLRLLLMSACRDEEVVTQTPSHSRSCFIFHSAVDTLKSGRGGDSKTYEVRVKLCHRVRRDADANRLTRLKPAFSNHSFYPSPISASHLLAHIHFWSFSNTFLQWHTSRKNA